jgi:hypothetical protein
LAFQGQNRLRQRRLAQVQLAGGRGQAALLRDGDEHVQFAYLQPLPVSVAWGMGFGSLAVPAVGA